MRLATVRLFFLGFCCRNSKRTSKKSVASRRPQRSSVFQVVPRTVADEKRPTVRYEPLPAPQRCRTERDFLLLASEAIFGFLGAFGQPLNLPPDRYRLANAGLPFFGLSCLNLK